jgi:hypothetical protein
MLNKVLPKVKITNCIEKFISKRIFASASSQQKQIRWRCKAALGSVAIVQPLAFSALVMEVIPYLNLPARARHAAKSLLYQAPLLRHLAAGILPL